MLCVSSLYICKTDISTNGCCKLCERRVGSPCLVPLCSVKFWDVSLLVHTGAIGDLFRILTQLINNRENVPNGAALFNVYHMHICLLSHVTLVDIVLFKHWLSIYYSGANLVQPCSVTLLLQHFVLSL